MTLTNFDFARYFDGMEFVSNGITVSPSSRETYKHSCYKKFYYYKVIKVKVNKINYPWFRDGTAIHRVIQVYYEKVKREYFGDLLNDITNNKTDIIKRIVRFCLGIIPKQYQQFAMDKYFEHFTNFAVFEFDRMQRIDGVFDIKDKFTFDKYYKPFMTEQQQNQYAMDRGISYRLDVLFLLPTAYIDNDHDIACVGDFKSGGGSQSLFYKTAHLKEEIKEQLTFPIPYLTLGKSVKYPIEAVVGCYTKKQYGFAYEGITNDDFLILYNDMNDIKAALDQNNFPRIYKWCKNCDYKYYCIREEGLMNRIEYKLGVKKRLSPVDDGSQKNSSEANP